MTRRMLLVVLALMGVMVLVATISAPQSGVSPRSGAPAPSQPRLTDPGAFDVSETLSSARGAHPEAIEAELGDRVEIVVEGSAPEAVALGALGTRSLEAGVPARFELLAEVPGRHPLVLVNEDRRIGTVVIR